MNIVFWILVVFGLMALWFFTSSVFIQLGWLLLSKWSKTLEILNEEKENKNE